MIGVRTYLSGLTWASIFVLQEFLPMKTIAMIVLAFCVGAAMHALLIRWGVWLFSRKCVRVEWIGERGGRRLYWLAITAAGIWYLVSAVRDGRSPLKVLAIEAAYVAGVFLYEHRDGVKAEVRRRLALLRREGRVEA